MKKWQIIGTTLGCLFLLAGCQKQSNQETAGSQATQTTSQEKKVLKKDTNESKEVSTKKSKKTQPTDTSLYASVLDKDRNDATATHASVYAFYDLNKDGQNELLLANYYNNQPVINSIYAIVNQQPTELGQSRVASAGGYRSQIALYQDGSLYFEEGQSTSPIFHGKLMQLTADNQLQVIKEQDYSYVDSKAEDVFGTKDKQPLALDQLKWQSITDGMDAIGLSMLQFASIEGSWGGGKYQITKDQIVQGDQKFVINGATIEANGAVKAGFYTQSIQEQAANDTEPRPGGAMIYFIPKGVDMSTTIAGTTITDASDHNRDRIWTGQSVTGFADSATFIYKD